MHRFFVDKIEQGRAAITGDDFAHARALRLKPGEEVALVCDGRAYYAKVEGAAKTEYALSVGGEIQSAPEPALKVTLYQAMPKGAKLEIVVQKCVELGIYAICPVILARCVTNHGGGAKLSRLRRIAKEAAMQSGRLIEPEVYEPLTLEAALKHMQKHDALLAPYEEAREPGLKSALSGIFSASVSDMGIVIGPEGGMEPEEVEKLRGLGAKVVSLGPRILRTETAGLCVLSAVMYEAGELG